MSKLINHLKFLQKNCKFRFLPAVQIYGGVIHHFTLDIISKQYYLWQSIDETTGSLGKLQSCFRFLNIDVRF